MNKSLCQDKGIYSLFMGLFVGIKNAAKKKGIKKC
jgi:hypothetical protein